MISFGESLKKSIEDEEDDGEDDFDAGNKLEFQEKTKHAFKIQSCFEVRRKPTYVLCVQSDSTRLSKKYSYLPMQYSSIKEVLISTNAVLISIKAVLISTNTVLKSIKQYSY